MKQIIGYEGLYKIDQNGNIFSEDREYTNSLGRTYNLKQQRIKPINHNTGYCVVRLSKDKQAKTIRLHRLIAENLIPNPLNKPYVNHIDGDKRNNHPSNLEWCTAKENSSHAIKTGLTNHKGTSNPACRFTFDDVDDWYFLLRAGIQIKDVASLYNCERNTIMRLIKKEIGDVLSPYTGKPRGCLI